MPSGAAPAVPSGMGAALVQRVARVREALHHVHARALTWVDYSAAVADVIAGVIPFHAYCCHTVDPGTILFTGSVNHNVGCSGSWLAHHEYVIDDINKWCFLANSGRIVGATSIDTHGELSRSARHRSQETFGFGDELRVSFVVDGVYWGAAAFLRRSDEPWFSMSEVQTLAGLAPLIGVGLRRALLAQPLSSHARERVDHG